MKLKMVLSLLGISFFIGILCIGCKNESSEEEVKTTTSTNDLIVPTDGEPIVEVEVKVSEWSFIENRQELIQTIEEVAQDGLLPQDYYLNTIKKYESDFNSLDKDDLEDYYELLTKSFNTYYKHMTYGKVDYNAIYKDWSLIRNPVRLDTLLNYALTKKKVSAVLKEVVPQNKEYQLLKKVLADFEKQVGKDGKSIELNDNLYLMSEHPQIINIKKKLLLWGLGDGSKIDTSKTEYDQNLMRSIKSFQEIHCIKPDGIINYETVKALNMTMSERKQQIVVNLERWRWFPRNLGREYLLINIPEYELYYYRDGKMVRKHKVVVGRTERKTPILSSRISYIALNPTWTVPETILKEDYLPEMEKDREYLLKKGITIYDQNQKEIKPKDWNPKRAHSYKYVQGADEDNVLGQVKFVFANTHFVYLHDTNQKYYFDKVKRNLSSGCIRVENPMDLAMDLSSKLMNYEARNSGKEKSLALKNFNTDAETKIHVLYYTAWGTKDGVRYRPDVYDFDKQLYDLIQKPATQD